VEKTIRIKEGETNIIAGLIRDEERQSMKGLPMVAKIPFLGKLFAANETEVKETDVIITLSPHIVRSMSVKPEDEQMLWLGIDNQQQQPGIYRPFSPVPAPAPRPGIQPLKKGTSTIQPQSDQEEDESDQDSDQEDDESTPNL
jgi:Flp pilus assembly secretin CpaC